MKYDLAKLKRIAKKYKLNLLVLFGSQAKNKTHFKSDLDLAFYTNKKINEEKLFDELIHLFKRTDIDLVNLGTNHNHFLRFQIMNESKLLYESDFGLQSKMKWQSYIDYMDFKKYYNLIGKVIDKKLKAA